MKMYFYALFVVISFHNMPVIYLYNSEIFTFH